MKILGITIFFSTITVLGAPLQAKTSTASCAAGLATNAVQFENAIQYDDIRSKANPTVHVLVNGKAAKMMMDTGSNKNILWNPSLLDEIPSQQSQTIDSHVASADAQRVEVMLGDGHGNAQRQEFYLLSNSALAAYGYSGILSPQAVARHNAVVIDFDKNCFFISPPFDIGSDNGLHASRGTTIQNPYDVMAIHVELDGRNIPLIVDSGASGTSILASLVASKPKGPESPRLMDIFGAELPKAEPMRLIDLKVNGQTFTSHPVIPAPTINGKGIGTYGYIGMDILKDRIVYHDGARQEFILLTRQRLAKHPVGEPETGIE